MNLRLSSLRAMSMYRGTVHLTVAAALTFALAGVGVGAGNAAAATDDAASTPEGSSVSYAAGSQYTVKPGQSLNDVAIAVTQSRDRATLVRASRALFDANPGGFMKNDPSRMRVGAVLTIPALDASGAVVASAPVAGSASAAPSTATAAAASAPSAPSAPSAATTGAAVGVASGVAQVNAAAASAASAAAHAIAPSAPAVSGTASSAAEASPATPGSSTTAAPVATAPVAGSQAASGVPASGAHVWSGAVQPSPSEAAEAASAAATAAAQAAATATAQPASQARTQVSSLQQLLALKNRVLMELQKHGIGGSAAVTGTRPPTPAPSTNSAQPAASASSAAAVSGHGSAAISTSNDAGISQTNLSVAAAIGAALVVLLAALGRRRKRAAVAATEGSLAQDAAAASARTAEQEDVVSTREQMPVREASDTSDDVAGYGVALSAAGREDAEREAAAREVAARVAAAREAEIRAAAERETAEHAEAERAAADQAAQERAAAEHVVAKDAAEHDAAAEHEAAAGEQAATREQTAAAREAEASESHPSSPTQDLNASRHASPESPATPAPFESAQPRADVDQAAHSGSLSEPLPAAHHENLDGATTAASLAAAAELGAEALPLTSLEPVGETFEQEAPAHRLQWDDEPALSASAAPPAASTNVPQNHLDAPAPVIDFTPREAEPHTTSPFGQPYIDTSAHSMPGTSVPAVPTVQEDTAHVDPAYQPSHESQPHQQPHQQAETASPDGASNLDPAPVAQTQPARFIPTEFPRDAVDAFTSLNMPLPPRVESTDTAVSAPESLATQLVASPETTAQQAVTPHDPDDAPHIADEISAGTAGRAAVAGLGATGLGAAGLGAIGFGALKLDFDLELPPSPAQPLPAFTRADLSRIARNKLDLAAEYIDLGDLSGARLLINEVIEANDPATRTEARALLSTLAPLS
ncbi:MAG: pilus assembly protein FimV [Paraburkholderia sp.]|nr:pilus assembly protein FimV [Paraburkholderia sp.]